MSNDSPPPRWKSWIRQIRSLLVVVLVLTAFRSAVADWNDVPSGSMRPTILEGDRIFVNKLAYDLKVPYTTWHLAKWSDPKRGDVVIFYSPEDGTRLVKRIVGIPGDVVEMQNERIFINGQPLVYQPTSQSEHDLAWEQLGDHRHVVMVTPALPAMRSFAPMTVPQDKYLVLGDNRDNSKDSRYIGMIPRDQIVGRASAVVLSVDPDRYYLPRWSRFFSALP